MITRRSPDILTVDQFYNFLKISSVERSRQTGQESPSLTSSGFIMILPSPTFTWQEEGSVQLSRVTRAARQEQGVLPQPPKSGGLQKEPPAKLAGMHTDWAHLELSSQHWPGWGEPVLQCCGGCAHDRGTQSCSEPVWGGTFPTPHLWGVMKHRAYFHLQQGLWHRWGQALKSVPCFWKKGRTAILSCSCKAFGAYKQCTSLKCCYLPQCCTPRLWQNKKSQLFWAVPYTIYFCQPQAHDTSGR